MKNRLIKKSGELSDMPPLEGDEKVKLESGETIGEKVKLNLPKIKVNRDRIKDRDSKKLVN